MPRTDAEKRRKKAPSIGRGFPQKVVWMTAARAVKRLDAG
jgi:hypothetical protein